VLQYNDTNASDTLPPLPPPAQGPTPLPPTPTASTLPEWMSTSTVAIRSCPAPRVQDSDVVDAILACENVCSSEDNDEEYSDIENALPCRIFELASSLRKPDGASERLKVEFDIIHIDVILVPQYIADPYRLTSISKIARFWQRSTTRGVVPYPYVSENGEWSKRWATRREARARVKCEQAWKHALARRSAVILALEPGVDAADLPDRWPTVALGDRKYTFGMCDWPARESNALACIHAPRICSPNTAAPEVVVDDTIDTTKVNVAMAARCDHHETPEIKIVPNDNPNGTPSRVRFSATVHDVTKTMVWTGYVRAQAVPTPTWRPGPLFGIPARSEVKDLDDNNKILDDTYAILYAQEHLARKLCEEPHEMQITQFCCDHPQYIVTDGADVATPGAGVRMSRTIKAQRDFGIRRWLADAGCGHDLVSTSLVLKGGGEA
jgi:hypothetical protein